MIIKMNKQIVILFTFVNKRKFWYFYTVLFFVFISNFSFTQETNPKKNNQKEKKSPSTEESYLRINSYYDLMVNDDFTSHKYGTNLEIIFLRQWDTEFVFESNFHHRNSSSEKYFPRNLYHLYFGLKAQGNKVLFSGKIGSNSNKLFHSSNEIDYKGYLAYNVLNSPKHFLYIGSVYERSIQIFELPISYKIPLPLILYSYKSDKFSFIGPIPLIIDWRITENIFLHCSSEEKLALSYYFSPVFSVGGELHFLEETYLIAKRGNINETLYYEGFKTGIRLTYLFISGFFGYGFQNQSYTATSDSGYFKTIYKTNEKDMKDSFVFDITLTLEI